MFTDRTIFLLFQLLSHLGIEKLVLPAATQLQTTWESSFGFSEMPDNERMELIGYPLLVFQGTTLIQKSIQPSKENATGNFDSVPRLIFYLSSEEDYTHTSILRYLILSLSLE